MQEQSKDFNMKIRDLEYQLDILQNEREENNTKVARRIEELEKEKQDFVEEQKKNNQLQIQQIEEQEKEIKDRLQEQIRELQQEGYKRTDEFLQLGVKMDELKEQLTISKENEVKLKNANDWLKEMNSTMQTILKKHEDDNRMLAEQLVAFKQQIIESDNFQRENKKFKGLRHGSFNKSEGVLYFTEESKGDNKTDKEYFLVMEYGSGSAVKVNLRSLEEFFIVENTNQICFEWPDKKWFKSRRTETFETDDPEAVLGRYLEVVAKMNEENEDLNPTENE